MDACAEGSSSHKLADKTLRQHRDATRMLHSTNSTTQKNGRVAMHTTPLQEDSAKGAFQLVDEKQSKKKQQTGV